MATLVTLGLVFLNPQAVWASAAMAVPKKGGYRLVSDYRAVNKQVKKVPAIMPNQEATMARLRGAKFFGKSDMLQGYWHCQLAEEAQKVAKPEGKYTPRRGTQSILNATGKFQDMMTQVLADLDCEV